jgi:hypothetical protein
MDARSKPARTRRRSGIVADLAHWWDGQLEDWHSGERHLAYTLIACSAILLLGLIIVPLSLPEELPTPPRKELLAQRYLRALPANAADRPTPAKVQERFGADGGPACTAKIPATYQTLLVKRGRARTFDRAAFAQMRIVHRVYCPDRAPEFNDYVRNRSLAAARVRAARAAALRAAQPY